MPEQLSILTVTPWFPNTPGERNGNFIYDSVKSLFQEGVDVSVLVAQPWSPAIFGRFKPEWQQGRLDIEKFNNIRILRQIEHVSIPRNILLPISNRFRKHSIGPELEKMAKEVNANIIHAHTEGMAPIAVEVGRRLSIPVVVTLHGINTASRYIDAPRQKVMFRNALNAAVRVILVGEPLRDFFNEITGQDKNFRIVNNGFYFPSKKSSQREIFSSERVRFISVSNLHEGKGIDINLKALSKLKTTGNLNWVYTIVGDGCERSNLEKLLRELGISDQVVIVGAIPHIDVYEHLAKADIFILPSYREAFGIAYVEAMAMGLLTIGVKGQGPSGFITDSETGILVEPRSANNLAERLVKVFDNREKMQAIAKAGCEYALSNLTWEAHAKQLVSVYKELLSA